ncbi:MAG TPA: alkaline phosphatase [Acidobacteriota bacterium]|nr:alkaline phosphatase [Acidobacteriota bacterium]HQG90988.1 alkaline phosphatase [Acidobacteriota bacterium]
MTKSVLKPMIGSVLLLIALSALWALTGSPFRKPPRHVILMIGDGMGINSWVHAHYFRFGATADSQDDRLAMESLPVTGLAYTHSADNLTTDSAASASALCTGRKVLNGDLSVAPDGAVLPTVFEEAAHEGLAVGLVTTGPVTHATPAAAYAHVPERNNYHQIFDWLLRTRPDLVLGSGTTARWRHLPSDFARRARAAGYTVCTSAEALQSARSLPLLGVFGGERLPYEWDWGKDTMALPHLSDLVSAALDRLGSDPDGFILMIEGGSIDTANHDNSLERAVGEVLEFDRCVGLVQEWVKAHSSWNNALLVVTADHETGELSVRQPGKPSPRGPAPSFSPGVAMPANTFAGGGYGSDDHSAAVVAVFAQGAGSSDLSGVMDNTRIHKVLRQAVKP